MGLDSLMDGRIGHFGEASQGNTEAQAIGCSKAARNHWYSPKNIYKGHKSHLAAVVPEHQSNVWLYCADIPDSNIFYCIH